MFGDFDNELWTGIVTYILRYVFHFIIVSRVSLYYVCCNFFGAGSDRVLIMELQIVIQMQCYFSKVTRKNLSRRCQKCPVVSLISELIDDRRAKMARAMHGPENSVFTTKGPITSACRHAAWMLNQADVGDLDKHVLNGYRFLMDHYEHEDNVCSNMESTL